MPHPQAAPRRSSAPSPRPWRWWRWCESISSKRVANLRMAALIQLPISNSQLPREAARTIWIKGVATGWLRRPCPDAASDFLWELEVGGWELTCSILRPLSLPRRPYDPCIEPPLAHVPRQRLGVAVRGEHSRRAGLFDRLAAAPASRHGRRSRTRDRRRAGGARRAPASVPTRTRRSACPAGASRACREPAAAPGRARRRRTCRGAARWPDSTGSMTTPASR